MPHIHTQPGQHDVTASAFIVDVSGPEPRLRLHWHKKIQGWLQFGGHIELHETPWQAVCHEIEEETGFDMDQLQVLQPAKRLISPGIRVHPVPMTSFTHIFPGLDHYHSDYALTFITKDQPRHPLTEKEQTEHRLVTRDELLQLPADELPDNVRDLSLYVFDVILPDWQPVDTAEFIR